jgi:transcriptional regulator with XRE-family HTH domain
MQNYGLIIHHLRLLAGLSVQQTAKRIERSTGWLSEVENGYGRSRLREEEFNRIVEVLDGQKHKSMFMTWVASYKKREKSDKTFDGAVLKFIRIKKSFSLKKAAMITGVSAAQISKLETGMKPVTHEIRDQIMIAYGYSPSSFKNLSTDPVRSKVVPPSYKLSILINSLPDEQIESIFQFALTTFQKQSQ